MSMVCPTDNPLADFNRQDAQDIAAMGKLPICNECGFPIEDKHYYFISGKIICQECLDENHKREIYDD